MNKKQIIAKLAHLVGHVQELGCLISGKEAANIAEESNVKVPEGFDPSQSIAINFKLLNERSPVLAQDLAMTLAQLRKIEDGSMDIKSNGPITSAIVEGGVEEIGDLMSVINAENGVEEIPYNSRLRGPMVKHFMPQPIIDKLLAAGFFDIFQVFCKSPEWVGDNIQFDSVAEFISLSKSLCEISESSKVAAIEYSRSAFFGEDRQLSEYPTISEIISSIESVDEEKLKTHAIAASFVDKTLAKYGLPASLIPGMMIRSSMGSSPTEVITDYLLEDMAPRPGLPISINERISELSEALQAFSKIFALSMKTEALAETIKKVLEEKAPKITIPETMTTFPVVGINDPVAVILLGSELHQKAVDKGITELSQIAYLETHNSREYEASYGFKILREMSNVRRGTLRDFYHLLHCDAPQHKADHEEFLKQNPELDRVMRDTAINYLESIGQDVNPYNADALTLQQVVARFKAPQQPIDRSKLH